MVSNWITSVALILKPMHGNVSPQYHAEFDDNLLTVPAWKTAPSLNGWISSNTQPKRAIATDFELAESWLAGPTGEVATDPLSDPLFLCLINTNVNGIDGIVQGPIPGNKSELIGYWTNISFWGSEFTTFTITARERSGHSLSCQGWEE